MSSSPVPRSERPGRIDRWAIWLSAACVVHCLATTAAVALLSTAGGLLGSPLIHEVGLLLALGLGLLAFGRGVLTHRRLLPVVLGGGGLVLMAAAIVAPHGDSHLIESLLTIAGVLLLAVGHTVNRRARG
ncbi:MerC domain-containing protein [Sphingomonas sp. RHCKR7]|uniref:MerC domain-containing protein n=1 Tax=Sphingomonas folli TaxID=2862497 RepID=UPI001C66F8BA|nr:MerC domain-containing protein [Sphingomonas folli]MBW6525433.1 MerC domain-containing protein [Sphingomonas folli]